MKGSFFFWSYLYILAPLGHHGIDSGKGLTWEGFFVATQELSCLVLLQLAQSVFVSATLILQKFKNIHFQFLCIS